jgi:hypothetical protein
MDGPNVHIFLFPSPFKFFLLPPAALFGTFSLYDHQSHHEVLPRCDCAPCCLRHRHAVKRPRCLAQAWRLLQHCRNHEHSCRLVRLTPLMVKDFALTCANQDLLGLRLVCCVEDLSRSVAERPVGALPRMATSLRALTSCRCFG